VSTHSEAISIARGVMADVEEWITETFIDPTLQELLDALQRGEEEAQQALRALLQLRARGIDQPGDYVRYNKLCSDLLGAQMQVYAVCRQILEPVSSEAVRRLPFPTPLPSLSYDREASARAASGGLRGLGEPITISTGAGIALAVAAVIIALGITYILAQVIISVAQEVAGVFIARARAQQFRDLCNARLEVYNQCLASGGSALDCAEAAGAAIPTPRESGTETPLPGALDPTPWVLIGVAGTLLVLVGGGLFWFYRKAQRAGIGRVPVRQVASLPSVQRVGDLDGNKSKYNLEIAGLRGRRTR
jgi:hypothetical protein